jgi:hypothetical protein
MSKHSGNGRAQPNLTKLSALLCFGVASAFLVLSLTESSEALSTSEPPSFIATTH